MLCVTLSGNGRHDSMGLCAKYCAYTIFCCTLPHIIHFALVQVCYFLCVPILSSVNSLGMSCRDWKTAIHLYETMESSIGTKLRLVPSVNKQQNASLKVSCMVLYAIKHRDVLSVE